MEKNTKSSFFVIRAKYFSMSHFLGILAARISDVALIGTLVSKIIPGQTDGWTNDLAVVKVLTAKPN